MPRKGARKEFFKRVTTSPLFLLMMLISNEMILLKNLRGFTDLTAGEYAQKMVCSFLEMNKSTLTNILVIICNQSIRLMKVRNLYKRVPIPQSATWIATVLPDCSVNSFQFHIRMGHASFAIIVNVLEHHCLYAFAK